MGKEIFYFSGTGNSFVVARDIAENIKARITPIVSLLNEKTIEIKSDIIGIVFPLQDFKAPSVVEEFVSKLTNLKGKYIFAICTYGLKPSISLKKLDITLQSRGATLSSGFAVKMPHNGIASGLVSQKDAEKDTLIWRSRISDICEIVNNHESNIPESSRIINDYFNTSTMKSISTLVHFVSVLLFKGEKGLAFTVDDKCISCGVCNQICPTENILLHSGKPVWGDHCVNCFACINWCSTGAITLGGHRFNMIQYHHSDVNFKDLSSQNKGINSSN